MNRLCSRGACALLCAFLAGCTTKYEVGAAELLIEESSPSIRIKSSIDAQHDETFAACTPELGKLAQAECQPGYVCVPHQFDEARGGCVRK